MKILFSGGHITPALAVIDYLKKHHSDIEIVFAGRLFTKQDNSQVAPEKKEIEVRGIPFIPFSTGKLSFSNPVSFVKNAWYLVIGLIRAIKIIHTVRPDVFMSFGGYLAVPLAIAAWIFKVPVFTHEQTRVAGFANRVIARFSKKIAVSFAETASLFPSHKTIVTGNPVRKLVVNGSVKKPNWFKLSSKNQRPILYITGGSQGSEILNATVSECVNELIKNWTVIHSCGPATRTRNYKNDLLRKRNQLSLAAQNRYYIREWCNEEELGWIYKNAETMVSRAGANTIQEIIIANIVSILVPLPFSHAHEQEINARYLQDHNAAVVIHQKDLGPQSLLDSLEIIQRKHKKMQQQLQELALTITTNADKTIAEMLLTEKS
ncbi:MAG: UDP-N-acetylglucosamine--N-acetylmuramyl-(pentapeptide) pyrophosphoryl-undecaprenol N-acetylglucosamine transferase [Microgenomates group bacterium]